jgi:biopolymer transport protein ExbB
MIDVIKSGGIIMVPIILCGVVATFIIIERLIFFYTTAKGEKILLEQLSPLLKRKEFTAIAEACDRSGTPLAALVKKAVSYRHYPDKEIKEAVLNEANREIPRLERFLTPLGTIANISTLLGLLGTVTGNIEAFGVLGSAGAMGNPAMLAGAISEALVTTAAGLVVSIPSIIFYNYFVSRVGKRVTGMEAASGDVIIQISGRERIT